MGERPEGAEKASDGSTATNDKLRWLTKKSATLTRIEEVGL